MIVITRTETAVMTAKDSLTISNEFIEQCENPNFEKLKKDIQIARAKDYLRDNDTKDGSEPSLEWCIISDLLRIIENR